MDRVAFVDTTLRDAHQSLWNGQMTTAMMLPIAPVIDQVGFEALDFMALISMDWCVRNQRENPWERVKLMARAMPNTPLIVGGVLRNFGNVPDSVTEFWAKKISEAGAGRLRINDPYHDMDQITKAIQWSKAAGMITMVALIYSYSPVHTDEYYAQKAREMAKRRRGAHFHQGRGRPADAGAGQDAGPGHQEGNRRHTDGTPRPLLHRAGPGLLHGRAQAGHRHPPYRRGSIGQRAFAALGRRHPPQRQVHGLLHRH